MFVWVFLFFFFLLEGKYLNVVSSTTRDDYDFPKQIELLLILSYSLTLKVLSHDDHVLGLGMLHAVDQPTLLLF